MAEHQPTDEQQAIVNAASQPESIMIEALAGCAKSTTLELIGRRVKVPALALAFNRKIAKDLEPRFAGNFSVKTLNGLGHGAWARSLPNGKLTLDDRKLGKLVTETARERKVDLSQSQWDDLRRLTSHAMQFGIVPGDEGEPLTADTPDGWEAAGDSAGLLPNDTEFLRDLAREVLAKDISLARQGIISFDDQVYCPTVLGGKWPLFPVVFVDESQDLSPLNHAMLAKCMRPDGRLVAVGDSRQAIYSFRGADAESMAKVRELRNSWLDFPLATTFRCPKAIVSRQLDHAPHFRAWDGCKPGRFEFIGIARTMEGAAEGWTWKQAMGLMPSPEATLAILCRNNGPLLGIAFRLLRRGIGCQMLGRDIGKGLTALARKLAPEDTTPADTFAGLLLDWEAHETSLARANGKPERIAGITDRAECLRAVLSHAGVRDVGQLVAALERLFARESGLVTLSSIHRAKGLEWDMVIHLDPWRIPSRYAKQAAQAGDSRALVQEWNLRYVAETRTKNVLTNANLEDFQ